MSTTSTTSTRSLARARVRVSQPKTTSAIETDRRFYQATMAPEKFNEFLTHPRQRDTERHAQAAQRRHLGEFSIAHANVSAAHWDGKYYKLDGHTRSLLWSRNQLQKPDKVTVTIYNCGSYDELLALYSTFDSKYATETGADQLSGALREAGIDVTSQMFRSYKFLSALKRAYAVINSNRGVYAYSAEPDMLLRQVKTFAKEIQMLDSIDPNLRLFRVGIAAPAFLILKKHGEAALPFFRALNENRGVQGDGTCDGVQALHNIIMTSTNGTNREVSLMMGRAFSCYETWRRGRQYSLSRFGVAGVKSTDVADYVKGLAGKVNEAAESGIEGVVTPKARPAIEVILPASL